MAVITGAGSGMAKASVKVFVREGARVVAADISGAEQDTAAEVGAGVLPVHCDVTKEADVEAMMATAVEEFGRVDAVLNVAGIADGCLLTDLTMEFYDRLMDVDLRGVMLGMKHGIRTMIKTAVAPSSIGPRSAASTAPPTRACTRRPSTDHRCQQVGCHRVRHAGVRVNTICPGFILTEIMAGERRTSSPTSPPRPPSTAPGPTRSPRSVPSWPPIGPHS